MKVHIAKVDEVLWSGSAVSLTAPAEDGEVTILTHHVPLVTPLKAGDVTVRPENGSPAIFKIEGGLLEVSPEGATVLL